jgi:hypothetical protein
MDYLKVVNDRSFMIYGMDKDTLLELRKQYFLAGGSLPMSPESVKAAFRYWNTHQK